jgi:hypothetical protein
MTLYDSCYEPQVQPNCVVINYPKAGKQFRALLCDECVTSLITYLKGDLKSKAK